MKTWVSSRQYSSSEPSRPQKSRRTTRERSSEPISIIRPKARHKCQRNVASSWSYSGASISPGHISRHSSSILIDLRPASFHDSAPASRSLSSALSDVRSSSRQRIRSRIRLGGCDHRGGHATVPARSVALPSSWRLVRRIGTSKAQPISLGRRAWASARSAWARWIRPCPAWRRNSNSNDSGPRSA